MNRGTEDAMQGNHMRRGGAFLAFFAVVWAALEAIHTISGAEEAWERIVEFITRNTSLHLEDNTVAQIFLGLIALLLACIFVAVLHRPEHRRERQEDRRRDTLLNVRSAYLQHMKAEVENRLTASLHGAVLLDLTANDRRDAALPWYFVGTDPASRDRVFHDLEEAFNHYNRRLLILDEPGAGKTTTILQITQKMIVAAIARSDAPVPLLVNLSRFQSLQMGHEENRSRLGSVWRAGRSQVGDLDRIQRHLANLVAELRVARLTSDVVNGWIESRSVAFILDGLDEVEESQRLLLARRMNETLFAAYPEVPTLVASRIVEYQMLQRSEATTLRLDGAIALQPLNPEQIQDYLVRAKVESIAHDLHSDSALQELATNPLTLSILALTYQGRGRVASTVEHALPERRRQLFSDFVDRMMQRQASREAGVPWDPFSPKIWPTPYSRETVNRYAGRLAVALSRRMLVRFPARHSAVFFTTDFPTDTRRFWSTRRLTLSIFAIILGLVVTIASTARIPTRFIYWDVPLWSLIVFIGYLTAVACEPVPAQNEQRGLGRWVSKLYVAALVAIVSWTLFAIFFASIAVYETTNHSIGVGVIPVLVVLAVFGVIWGQQETWLVPVIMLAGMLLVSILGHRQWATLAVPAGTLVATAIATLTVYFEATSSGSRSPGRQLRRIAIGLAWAAGMMVAAACSEVSIFLAHSYLDTTVNDPASALIFCFGIGIVIYVGDEVGASSSAAAALAFAVLPLSWAWIACAATLTLLIIESEVVSKWHSRKDFFDRLGDALSERVEWILLLVPSSIALVLRGEIPWRFRRFLRFLTECLLVRESDEGYGFIHLLIRDYFAVGNLARALSAASTSRQDRIRAIRQLGLQGEASVAPLRELLDDDDPEVRTEAIRTLGRVPSPNVPPIMVGVLKGSNDGPLRANAVTAAARASTSETDEIMTIALQDPDPEVRRAAVSMYSRLDERQREHFAPLTLADPDDRIVRASVVALGRQCRILKADANPNRLVAIVADLLDDPVPANRTAAVTFVGRTQLEQGANLLLKSLSDTSDQVRVAAIRSLIRLPQQAAIPAAISASKHESVDVRLAAITFLSEVVGKLHVGQDDLFAFASVFRSAMRDVTGQIRAQALPMATTLPGVDIYSVLQEAAKDRDLDVRQSWLRLIERICTAGQEQSDQLAMRRAFADDVLRALRNPQLFEHASAAAAAMFSPDDPDTLRRYVNAFWSPRQRGAVDALRLMKAESAAADIAALLRRITCRTGRLMESAVDFAADQGLVPGGLTMACATALAAIGSAPTLATAGQLLMDRNRQFRLIGVRSLLTWTDPDGAAKYSPQNPGPRRILDALAKNEPRANLAISESLLYLLHVLGFTEQGRLLWLRYPGFREEAAERGVAVDREILELVSMRDFLHQAAVFVPQARALEREIRSKLTHLDGSLDEGAEPPSL